MIIGVGVPLLKSYEEFMKEKQYVNERTAREHEKK